MSGEAAELARPVDAVPVDWQLTTLGGALAKSEGGGTPPRDVETYWNGDIPWASVKDVVKGEGSSPEEAITSAGLANSTSKLIPAGTNIFAARMGVGAVVRYPFPVAINQDLMALTPSSALDPGYLFYWLQARKEAFVAVATGTTVKGIRKDVLLSFPMVLPPLDEQRRIAEVLRSVDEAIAAADGVIGQLREARGHRLETLMALPGTYRRIDEVCRLSGGFGFPIKHQGKSSGRYPFAKVSDMNRLGNEMQMRHAENYVDDVDLRTLKARTFPVGTTFFPKVGATLLTNKRRIAAVEMLVDNNVMGAVATEIDPWFLYYAFCTIDMADYVQPGAVPSVNQRTIGQIMIPVPDVAAQKEFVETMRDLDAAIEMQSSAMAQLTATKQPLMSDLLSGRVRVPA